MANAVARTGKTDTVLFRHCLDIAVIVGIFKTSLQRVVVYVRNGKFRLNAIDPHCLELQIRHRTRCILRQCLIDF